jgi:hypothetical protein
MLGIPVSDNGEPVWDVRVLAGDYSQFRSWCHFSHVNPNSHRVHALTDGLHDLRKLRGITDTDFVFTGLWNRIRSFELLTRQIRVIEAGSHYKGQRYDQLESANITPNILSDRDCERLFQQRAAREQ